jgi:hypothetical protein
MRLIIDKIYLRNMKLKDGMTVGKLGIAFGSLKGR